MLRIIPPIRFVVAIMILLACGTRLNADSYLPSRPEAFLSPSGKNLVRIEAADSVKNAQYYWKHTEFNVFSYNEKTENYERITKFDVEGHPLKLFINDAGTYIVTIDQQFGSGFGQIAAIYDLKGKRLAQWTLRDVLHVGNDINLRRLPNFRKSTSSIYWRGGAGWSLDQNTIQISQPPTSETQQDRFFTITYPADIDSYEIDIKKLEMRLVNPTNKKEKGSGAAQPTATPESKPERPEKPKP